MSTPTVRRSDHDLVVNRFRASRWAATSMPGWECACVHDVDKLAFHYSRSSNDYGNEDFLESLPSTERLQRFGD